MKYTAWGTLVFLTALVATLGVLTVPAHAIESFGIGAVPANPRADNPRTKSIFVYDTPPEKVITDGVRVVNNSKTKRTIKVYAVDSARSSDGAFACAQAADPKQEVGKWIALEKQEVTLQPGQNEVVPFTLKVPAKVDVGEHNGCIAIEEAQNPSQANGNGIVLSFRSALRVAAVVPGDISAQLRFVNVKDQLQRSKMVISPIVKNTGNVSVDATVHVGLKNILGQPAVAREGQFAVLTKDESRFNFELDPPFWGGWYQLEANATYQPLRSSAAAHVSTQHTKATSRWLYVAPQPLAMLLYCIALLIIVGGMAVWIIRRRTWRFMHQHAKKYTIKEGDNLQRIATIHHANWKTLAKLNNLKPPYTLRVGHTLKVPSPEGKTHAKKKQNEE